MSQFPQSDLLTTGDPALVLIAAYDELLAETVSDLEALLHRYLD